MWHHSVRVRSVGLWLVIPTGHSAQGQGLFTSSWRTRIMTPNPYTALVLTPQTDASGPDRSGAHRRAARGDVPH